MTEERSGTTSSQLYFHNGLAYGFCLYHEFLPKSLHMLLEDAAVTVEPEGSDVLGELTHTSCVYTSRQHHLSECGLSPLFSLLEGSPSLTGRDWDRSQSLLSPFASF